jgi:ornithine--oxo-acid transaminase
VAISHQLLEKGEYQHRSAELGNGLHERLNAMVGNGITEVRGRGLWPASTSTRS